MRSNRRKNHAIINLIIKCYFAFQHFIKVLMSLLLLLSLSSSLEVLTVNKEFTATYGFIKKFCRYLKLLHSVRTSTFVENEAICAYHVFLL